MSHPTPSRPLDHQEGTGVSSGRVDTRVTIFYRDTGRPIGPTGSTRQDRNRGPVPLTVVHARDGTPIVTT